MPWHIQRLLVSRESIDFTSQHPLSDDMYLLMEVVSLMQQNRRCSGPHH